MANASVTAKPDVAAWFDMRIAAGRRSQSRQGRALDAAELTERLRATAGNCPTFRGLYYGLAQLETDMHVHD